MNLIKSYSKKLKLWPFEYEKNLLSTSINIQGSCDGQKRTSMDIFSDIKVSLYSQIMIHDSTRFDI